MSRQTLSVPLSVIAPKRPTGPGWQRQSDPPKWVSSGYDIEAWLHVPSGLFAFSSVEVALSEGGIDKGPEYHISVSLHGQRCTSADAMWVMAQFGVPEAEEDNHVPSGRVRNFWRPVGDKWVGLECHCKAEEPAIREDKGDYVWRGVTP